MILQPDENDSSSGVKQRPLTVATPATLERHRNQFSGCKDARISGIRMFGCTFEGHGQKEPGLWNSPLGRLRGSQLCHTCDFLH